MKSRLGGRRVRRGPEAFGDSSGGISLGTWDGHCYRNCRASVRRIIGLVTPQRYKSLVKRRWAADVEARHCATQLYQSRLLFKDFHANWYLLALAIKLPYHVGHKSFHRRTLPLCSHLTYFPHHPSQYNLSFDQKLPPSTGGLAAHT